MNVDSTSAAASAARSDSHTSSDSSPRNTAPRARPRRLVLLFVVGVITIGAALAFRNSAWVKENRLKKLSEDELKLAAIDAPNDPMVALHLARVLMEEEHFEEAVPAFERAVKLNPKSAIAHLGLGSALFRTGRPKSAAEAFEKTIKLDPKLPDAHLGLAQVYYGAGSAKRAIEPMKQVVALQPKNSLAWYSLGQMYGDARLSDMALEATNKAVELNPNNALFLRSRGKLLMHYSRLDEANKDFIKSIKLDQSDAVTWLWLGQLYLQMGDTAKYRGPAETCFLSAVSRQPDMSEGYFGLGKLYERRSLWEMAAVNYRRAHEADSSNDQALYRLGICLVKQGKKAEGNKLIAASYELGTASREMRNLENLCIMQPENRINRLRLARLYRKYGNDEGARDRYIEYMRMGPPDPAVEKEIAAYRAQLERRQAKEGTGGATGSAGQASTPAASPFMPPLGAPPQSGSPQGALPLVTSPPEPK